jgi:F0F1-type ATP synthase membrane subunit b/b'
MENTSTSMKEVRAYVASRAKQAAAWARLDAELGKAADLDRVLASRQSEVEQCEALARKARDEADAANKQAAKTMADARHKADEVIADAKKTQADAEKRAADVDAILADARQKASRIVDEGRGVGKRLAEELDGEIPKLRAKIKALRAEETRTSNAAAALEQRAAKAEARLAELRADLAKIA